MSMLTGLAGSALKAAKPASENTIREYYKNTYLYTLKAKVLAQGSDQQGHYIVPDSTIFHPQGGGQPSDRGTFTLGSSVFNVTALVEGKGFGPIRHYFSFEGDVPSLEGREISMKIDSECRETYAKLHSAGHFLSAIVEKLYPQYKGVKGNHFPKQSFVEFAKKEKSEGKEASKVGSEQLPDKSKLKEILDQNIAKVLESKPKVIVDNSPEGRTVEIDGIITYPCGGTHIDSFDRIESISIRSIKNKKGILRVGYNIV